MYAMCRHTIVFRLFLFFYQFLHLNEPNLFLAVFDKHWRCAVYVYLNYNYLDINLFW